MKIIIYTLFSFLMGSIPFSYIITKYFFYKDITKIWDKNPGATNAFRAAGTKAGIPSLIFDISKGYVVAYISQNILFLKSFSLYLVLFMVILGHAYSVFLHFKGGKSIATTIGVLFSLYGLLPPLFFGVGCFLGLIMYKTDTHSTVIGIWTFMIYGRCFMLPFDELLFLLALCIFLTYRQLRTPPIEVDLIAWAKNVYKNHPIY